MISISVIYLELLSAQKGKPKISFRAFAGSKILFSAWVNYLAVKKKKPSSMLVVSSWFFNQIIYLFILKLLQYSRQEPCRLIAQLVSPSVSNGDVHASNPLPSTIKSSKIVTI